MVVGPIKVKGHAGKRAHKGKGTLRGELKQSGGQKFIPYSPTFKNDGTTVECSTLILLQIQLAILCF